MTVNNAWKTQGHQANGWWATKTNSEQPASLAPESPRASSADEERLYRSGDRIVAALVAANPDGWTNNNDLAEYVRGALDGLGPHDVHPDDELFVRDTLELLSRPHDGSNDAKYELFERLCDLAAGSGRLHPFNDFDESDVKAQREAERLLDDLNDPSNARDPDFNPDVVRRELDEVERDAQEWARNEADHAIRRDRAQRRAEMEREAGSGDDLRAPDQTIGLERACWSEDQGTYAPMVLEHRYRNGRVTFDVTDGAGAREEFADRGLAMETFEKYVRFAADNSDGDERAYWESQASYAAELS